MVSEQTKECGALLLCATCAWVFKEYSRPFGRQFKGMGVEGVSGRKPQQHALEISCCINATYFSCLQTQPTGAKPVGAEI